MNKKAKHKIARSFNQRLEDLESLVARAGRGCWYSRTPWAAIIDRWRAGKAAGLELDQLTGDLVTLGELRRRDPERAQALEERRRQAAESISLLGEDT